MKKVFEAKGDFQAVHDAEKWLESLGYSYGPMQGGAPRAIMLGDWDISKWRNLSAKEQKAVHGTITGEQRNGPVIVNILDSIVSQNPKHKPVDLGPDDELHDAEYFLGTEEEIKGIG